MIWVGLIGALLTNEHSRADMGRNDLQIPMRPDHGHLMADEVGQLGTNPGYSYLWRVKGLLELYGVIDTLERLKKV